MLLILSLFPAFIHHNSPHAPREPIAQSPWILSQLAPATKRFHGNFRFHFKRSARRKAQATATRSKPIDSTRLPRRNTATNRQSQNTNRRRESARLRFVNRCVVQLPRDSRAALLSADAPTVQQCGKVTAVDYAVLIEITELEDDDARVEEENLRGLLGVRCGLLGVRCG